MYRDDKTIEHKRDTRGNVVQDKPNHVRRRSGFATALTLTLALGVALSGLLLYTAIQQNEANLARIQNLETENAVMRSSAEHPRAQEQTASVAENVTVTEAKPESAPAVEEPAQITEPVVAGCDTGNCEPVSAPEKILDVDNGETNG